MSQSDNGRLPLAKRRIRSRISSDRWEQIKVAYVSGIGLREIARKMTIPEGTVLAHAKRHGWTQQIQVATRELSVMQSDAITPVQSVPQSIAAILSERKERTKLGLSKYAAEAAEAAAEHRDKLGIAGKVKDVASVHTTLWPEGPKTNEILPGWRILIGAENVIDAKTGYVCDGPDKGKFFPINRDQEEEKSNELPSPVFAQRAKVGQRALGCSATDVIADEDEPAEDSN
jgi:hypothetical protein